MKHPGRGLAARPLAASPDVVRENDAWQKLAEAYTGPFHRQWPDDPGGAGYMLDFVSEALFDPAARTFRTINKSAVFPAFLEPFEEEDGNFTTQTTEQADAALAFLVEQNMVVVDGDLISIHPRFADVLAPSVAPADANEDRISDVSLV